MQGSRKETETDYRQRISRVIAYIELHLSEPLLLTTLSEVACFSSYHFHRIFTAYVGETVNQYVRRLKLEKAAFSLVYSQKSITDIALDSGYETPSAFNKAFKQQFGSNPSQFKREFANGAFPQLTKPTLITYKETTMNPEIIERKDVKVAAVRRTGPYDQAAQQAWGALCTFAGPRGLLKEDVEYVGVSYDDPAITPAEKLRYDACVSIDEDIDVEGDVEVQTLAGGSYAMFLHKGSYEGLSAVYGEIFGSWLPQSGKKLREVPCFEKYLNSPEQVPPEELMTEIYIGIE